MRRSARSTEPRRRRAGFTLIEVLVASSILAVVLVLAYSQVSESTRATKQVTADADLRRVGEDILMRIGRDLRSTQAQFASASGNAIELYKVTGFDTTTGAPTLEGGVSPSTVLYHYGQSTATVTVDGAPMYGILELAFGTTAMFQAGSVNRIQLSRELDLAPNGFVVTPVPAGFPVALLSVPGPSAFPDQPTILDVRIRLRRRLGKRFQGELGTAGDWFATTTVRSQFELRPSKNY